MDLSGGFSIEFSLNLSLVEPNGVSAYYGYNEAV